MKNDEIKAIIKENRLYCYEVAEKIGITEFTLCRWFRKEMSEEQKEKVITAIAALCEEKELSIVPTKKVRKK
ncbi:MAG: hypothetical protein KBA55_09545 [Ruminococcus sp.]|nr:hypothetical protein [Ruminococcus sp.]